MLLLVCSFARQRIKTKQILPCIIIGSALALPLHQHQHLPCIGMLTLYTGSMTGSTVQCHSYLHFCPDLASLSISICLCASAQCQCRTEASALRLKYKVLPSVLHWHYALTDRQLFGSAVVMCCFRSAHLLCIDPVTLHTGIMLDTATVQCCACLLVCPELAFTQQLASAVCKRTPPMQHRCQCPSLAC